jgi:hypothetical protein
VIALLLASVTLPKASGFGTSSIATYRRYAVTAAGPARIIKPTEGVVHKSMDSLALTLFMDGWPTSM